MVYNYVAVACQYLLSSIFDIIELSTLNLKVDFYGLGSRKFELDTRSANKWLGQLDVWKFDNPIIFVWIKISVNIKWESFYEMHQLSAKESNLKLGHGWIL